VRPAAAAGSGVSPMAHLTSNHNHKVRQWYPSEQRHRVLYRGSYVKGPGQRDGGEARGTIGRRGGSGAGAEAALGWSRTIR
jgi:hypothetical protein